MKSKFRLLDLRILTLGSALLLATTVFGQQPQTSAESAPKPKFGIKGAFALTTLYSSDVSTNHMKPGFDAGVFAKLPVTKGFSIQPELLYSLKGSKESYDNFLQGSGEYRFNLGYIQLPVLAVVNITPNFSLHAGGYAAYLVNSNIKNVDNNGNVEGTTELNTSDFNRWDFGLAGGAAFDIENFTLGARYNYGLSDIGKSGSVSGDLTKGQKNAGFSFYVGFGF
jgi:hypothetical protein